jgi:Ulp1 family protease
MDQESLISEAMFAQQTRSRKPLTAEVSWAERIAILKDDEDEKVNSILTKEASEDIEDIEDIIVERFNQPMTKRLLIRLRPQGWLHDEVINFNMQMLQERDSMLCRSNYDRVPSHYFSSFFMNKLMDCGGYNYNNVKRYYCTSDCISHTLLTEILLLIGGLRNLIYLICGEYIARSM